MPPKASPAAQTQQRPPCPVCGKPADDHYRPFCSKRCADIDLNRWLRGVYAIPSKEDEEEDGNMPQTQIE
jgi:endogenous inhibitor of DNA gyrase (YacG/DUF329 family)